MIALTNAPVFGTIPITGWLTGDIDGNSVKLTVPLDGPDGLQPYLSIQPDGTYEGRASGGGAYESFTKRGSDLVFHYQIDGRDVVHVVPFKDLS